MRKMEKLGKPEKKGQKASRKGRTAGRAAAFGLVLAALFCTGCGESGDGMSNNVTSNNGYYTESMSADSSFDEGEGGLGNIEASAPDKGDVSLDTDRKLIRTVRLSVETKEFDRAMSALETKVGQLGGYIEELETYNGSRYSGSRSAKYSNLTVRIPKQNLDSFLTAVSDLCNVVRRNDDLQDVTLSYVDMESRRNTLRTEQDRLLSFLEQAQTVEEIIALEERLSDVRYQLESMESRLRTIDNQVDYSTVHLDISEVQDLTPVVEQTAWERLVSGFGDSVRDIGDGFVEFGIWFVVNIPYFVLWGIVIALFVFLLRLLRKRTEKKRDRLRAEAAAAAAAEAERQSRLPQ